MTCFVFTPVKVDCLLVIMLTPRMGAGNRLGYGDEKMLPPIHPA